MTVYTHNYCQYVWFQYTDSVSSFWTQFFALSEIINFVVISTIVSFNIYEVLQLLYALASGNYVIDRMDLFKINNFSFG